MMAAKTPAEAMFKIERELLSAAARCMRVRYFPYPCSDGRLVIACAELADGSDLQVLCPLDWPVAVNGDDYDELAIAAQFTMPSAARH